MITKNNALVVLNAGSSSLRFSLYDMRGGHLGLMARGRIEGIGTAARFEAKDAQGATLADTAIPADLEISTLGDALKCVAAWLQRQYGDHMALVAVGHQISHGGTDFVEPTLINAEVLEALEKLIPLSPVYLPHNLMGVKAVSRLWPDVPQVACFETAFHWGRARITQHYGLPRALFEQGVRRWGFHGSSYESVAAQFRDVMPQLASGRLIVAHLGDGVSLCAMNRGRSADATTGFTTLEGPPMGTRCGSLDPGVILYLLRQMTPQQIEELLYTQSGLLGISGISGDMRQLLKSEDPKAQEAVDYFVYHVMREITSLAAAMGGFDALVFTAGIGEHSPEIRNRICQGLAWLGVKLDDDANEGGHGCISRTGRSPSVWVIPSDEEGIIAEHTMDITSMLPGRMAHQRGERDERAVSSQ